MEDHGAPEERPHCIGVTMPPQIGLTVKTKDTLASKLQDAIISRVDPGFRGREVRGVAVAPENLLHALYAYPPPLEVRAFSTGDLDGSRRWVSTHCSTKQVDTNSVQSLSTALDPDTMRMVSLWFESGAQYALAYQLRDRLSRSSYPITCTVHGLSEPDLLYGQFLRVILAHSVKTDSFVCTTAACKLALSSILEELSSRLASIYGLRRHFQGRFDVIPLCVDTERICPADKEAAKRSLWIPSGSTFLLYVGRISLLKADFGPLLLLLANDLQRVKKFNLLLGIAGTAATGFVSHLKSYSQAVGFPLDRLRIFEDITEATKLRLLQAADIFTSPSDTIQECFGLTPVEAMAAGLPQVVSDWSGYRETVVNSETGFTTPRHGLSAIKD